MVEILFAMIILAVGMVALSSLAAQTMTGTAQSRFMGLSATLVSEKLEDLNRWPTWDPHVCVASGTTAGSLTADVQAASVTCNSITDTVDYYDDVEISDSTGAICETVSSISGGAQLYTTTCHQSNGLIATTTSTTANTADIGAVAFHRRWTIEMDQPITRPQTHDCRGDSRERIHAATRKLSAEPGAAMKGRGRANSHSWLHAAGVNDRDGHICGDRRRRSGAVCATPTSFHAAAEPRGIEHFHTQRRGANAARRCKCGERLLHRREHSRLARGRSPS